MGNRSGSIHLFRFAGIDLFLHWSWFVFAVYEINGRGRAYSTISWNILEFLTLFSIVTLHEFGHALACRQVGGIANRIVLWPLGGVAYVDPPPRPGATLWSIVAGPLVNVILLLLATLVGMWGRTWGFAQAMPNAHALVRAVWFMNLGLLIFNLLPIYPLDGGQIFRSLLWFVLGRARSLMVATIVGFAGVAGLIVLALWRQDLLFGAICIFLLMNCWGGLQHARALAKMAKLPRREGFVCPTCGSAPPVGDFWRCGRCGQSFDTFQAQATCPACRIHSDMTQCLDCRRSHAIGEWMASALPSR